MMTNTAEFYSYSVVPSSLYNPFLFLGMSFTNNISLFLSNISMCKLDPLSTYSVGHLMAHCSPFFSIFP